MRAVEDGAGREGSDMPSVATTVATLQDAPGFDVASFLAFRDHGAVALVDGVSFQTSDMKAPRALQAGDVVETEEKVTFRIEGGGVRHLVLYDPEADLTPLQRWIVNASTIMHVMAFLGIVVTLVLGIYYSDGWSSSPAPADGPESGTSQGLPS